MARPQLITWCAPNLHGCLASLPFPRAFWAVVSCSPRAGSCVLLWASRLGIYLHRRGRRDRGDKDLTLTLTRYQRGYRDRGHQARGCGSEARVGAGEWSRQHDDSTSSNFESPKAHEPLMAHIPFGDDISIAAHRQPAHPTPYHTLTPSRPPSASPDCEEQCF